MLEFMDKKLVIDAKQTGKSNRAIARELGMDRKTVSKYWEEYKRKISQISEENADVRQIQDELFETPKYNITKPRKKRKYTEKIEKRLMEILKSEKHKTSELGATHKQKVTNKQIIEVLQKEGYDIGYATINNALARLRNRPKQVFIRQSYDFGERVEYDFGEVRLKISGAVGTYHMAVFAAPASGFRWCKLYTNQKKGVFMDSHVRFFEFMRGCWGEVVYDNMKNVVTKFIGKNEKELNDDLIKMSHYYGFSINVTNCFSGNEKGTVEKSVDVLRTEFFALNYTFNTLDDAQEYVNSRLLKLNENSHILEERAHLLPHLPPLEIANITTAKADKTALISVDCVKYSVPEEFAYKRVIVKKYHDEIRVFYDNREICRHRRAFGKDVLVIDIMHYLRTFEKKPGALKSSVALKRIPQLKAIFDTYYAKRPKEFIEILNQNSHLELDEILALFKAKTANKAEFNAYSVVKPVGQIDVCSRSAMANYTLLIKGGVDL